MKRVVLLAVGAVTLATSPSLTPGDPAGGRLSLVRSAQGGESWKQQFEEVCGKTDESMNLSKDELKSLMAQCDKLKPLIEAQDETVRKVYLRRLQMCRDLLAYVYEVKSRN
jgi:hypothetical protein